MGRLLKDYVSLQNPLPQVSLLLLVSKEVIGNPEKKTGLDMIHSKAGLKKKKKN